MDRFFFCCVTLVFSQNINSSDGINKSSLRKFIILNRVLLLWHWLEYNLATEINFFEWKKKIPISKQDSRSCVIRTFFIKTIPFPLKINKNKQHVREIIFLSRIQYFFFLISLFGIRDQVYFFLLLLTLKSIPCLLDWFIREIPVYFYYVFFWYLVQRILFFS